MEKKQTRASAKSAPKARVGVRKVTVRDLDARKGTDIKAGTQGLTIGQRCR